MAVMILAKVYMETVVVNNTKYDVLVEEEARLVRFSFSDKHGDDDCDNANYDDYYGDNGANFVTASADDNDDIDEDEDVDIYDNYINKKITTHQTGGVQLATWQHQQYQGTVDSHGARSQ